MTTTPTFGEMLDETLPLIGFVPVAGPPVVLIAGPWLLLALMLVGYFALMVTVVALLGAAAAVVALIRELFAAAFRLFHDLRGFPVRHPSIRPSAAHLVVRESR